MGAGVPVPVSAAHGEGLVKLHDAIMDDGKIRAYSCCLVKKLSMTKRRKMMKCRYEDGPEVWVEGDEEAPLSLAIIGRQIW